MNATKKMIINALDAEEVRIAILDQTGKLEDFDIETRGVEKNKGNIYKGTVMAVEPALNAAFVDYGAEKQGFLTANDVDPRLVGKKDDKQYRIDELLKPKQEVLVQVEKDEVGAKGAVLSTYLSLAGRYTVLMPGSQRQGVSRKIDDEETRRRMKEAAARLDVPEDMGVIIRTAGKDRMKSELARDLKVLLRMWENIQKEAQRSKGPALILKEQDVIIRALRDYFSAEINEIVVDSDEAFDRASEYMHLVMPKQHSVLTRYVERRPIFHHYRIEDQLEYLFARKVPLSNGGSIVIEPTEALVSVDVNSGKQKQRDQEATALQTNLEAAKEVARQLRLRDLGGIIVIDFIDMTSRKNQSLVERAIKEALRHDKARVKVSRISPNGTLELTRQRIRSALGASVFRVCPTCSGTGHTPTADAQVVSVLRKLRDRASRGDLKLAKVHIDSEAGNLLRTEKWTAVQDVENRFNVRIDIILDKARQPGQTDFTFETDPHAVVVEPPPPDFGPPELPEGWEPPPAETLPEGEDDFLDEELAEVLMERLPGEDLMNDRGRRRRRDRDRSSDRAERSEGRREKEPLTPEERAARDQRREAQARAESEREAIYELFEPTYELIDPADITIEPERPVRTEAQERGDEAGSSEDGEGRRGRRGRGRGRGRGRERKERIPEAGGEVEVVSALEILGLAKPSPKPELMARPSGAPSAAASVSPLIATTEPITVEASEAAAAAASADETGENGGRPKLSFLARLFGRKKDDEATTDTAPTSGATTDTSEG